MAYGRAPLQIGVIWEGVIATVTVSGELDLTSAPRLTECLLKVGETHPERLVLDLSGLVFVDVAGARALDASYQALEAVCPVILRRPQPSARKVFRRSGLMDDEGTAGAPA